MNHIISTYIEKNNNELSNYLSVWNEVWSLFSFQTIHKPATPSISRVFALLIKEQAFQLPIKIVILGDTNNAESVHSICTNPSILIHECTLLSNPTYNKLNSNGHSNAQMAVFISLKSVILQGQLARYLNAKNLVLTHFSRKLNKLDSNEYNNIFDSVCI